MLGTNALTLAFCHTPKQWSTLPNFFNHSPVDLFCVWTIFFFFLSFSTFSWLLNIRIAQSSQQFKHPQISFQIFFSFKTTHIIVLPTTSTYFVSFMFWYFALPRISTIVGTIHLSLTRNCYFSPTFRPPHALITRSIWVFNFQWDFNF